MGEKKKSYQDTNLNEAAWVASGVQTVALSTANRFIVQSR